MGGKKKKPKNAGKKAKSAGAKAAEKKRARIVEDKTFGLKNKKKSKKVQAFVATVKQQVSGGEPRRGRSNGPGEGRSAKAAKAARDREMAQLFKVSIKPPKLAPGVDPKSVLCPWFKLKACLKGKKCKYSHDPAVNRKTKKIDLHQDMRETKEADTMDKWDQEKLEAVVAENSKQQSNLNRQTDIVCKYFLDAIEKEVYGWFWKCPNGGSDCKYRHALPPGYIFKTKRQRDLEKLLEENKDDAKTMEAIIEQKRRALPSTGLTPVTLETFTKWKAARLKKREKAEEAKLAAANTKAKKGRGVGNILSGRALFTFDPSLFVDDDDAADDMREEMVGPGAGADGDGAGAGLAPALPTPPGGEAAEGAAVVLPPPVPAAAAAEPAVPVDASLYLAADDVDLDDLDDLDD